MKRRLLLPLALMTLGLVLGAYGWLHSPGTTTPDAPNSRPVDSVLGSSTTLVTWNTGLFSSRLPSDIRVRTSREQSTGNPSGMYLLTSSAPRQSDQIGVSVGRLGNETLDELSGVHLRLSDPATYVPANRSYAPAWSYVFQRSDDTETAIFWQQAGWYASVVASGSPQRSGELEQALAAIVGNWAFNTN